jgi:NUMOD3 motif
MNTLNDENIPKKRRKGRTQTAETREKIRISNTGKTLTDEQKRKVSDSKIGVAREQFSDEWIENLSKAKTGENNPMHGVPHSDQAKEKIREKKIGIARGAETAAKIAASKLGKTPTKEQCPHCNQLVAPNMMKRWHGDNCKMNLRNGQ